jgi:hypothetical protein
MAASVKSATAPESGNSTARLDWGERCRLQHWLTPHQGPSDTKESWAVARPSGRAQSVDGQARMPVLHKPPTLDGMTGHARNLHRPSLMGAPAQPVLGAHHDQ